ncbi:FtsX-like permease family protein [Wenxinia saemankumensis]|uniref:Putative ABC transport system permease protein n=1 Tax=Wenxinia saemankumensis TaxID=1447782 RepID=A0A1M6EMC9_9RHOB|nr:FtsX-like permease family protein [Wenxinia saemankumensis]SHI86428.1 putative ABC transport system permease protein [Wenxinia saemankumensis]
MRRQIARALWSHWRRAPLLLFTLVAGLALATALWSGVQAINAEARASYDAAAATLGEGRFDQLVREGGIARADYVALRRAGWQVSPVIEGRLGGVRIVGLDPLTAPGGIGPVAMDESDLAAFLSGDGAVYGAQAALDALPPGPAERVLAPDVAPGTVLTDIAVAAGLLGRDPAVIDRLIVAEVQPRIVPPLDEVAPGLTRRTAQGGADIGRLTDSFHLNLTAFGLLAFAVGIFIVHGAIGLAFEERRPLVRTLRALGAPLSTVVWMMGLELLALALIAGALGLALGFALAGALLPDVAATLRGLYGAEVAGSLSLRPGWALAALGISVGGAALAGASALWRIARMPLLAAGRPRAWARGGARGLALQAVAGALLLAVAGGIVLVGGGLGAGFAALGALLVGGALLLPPLLDRALALGARTARGPVAGWLWADGRQQLPGLSLALMALLLAMAANVGVSTMVGSFRSTFTAFLDQRLFADLYVDAGDGDRGAALEAALAGRATVLPVLIVTGEVSGVPVEIQAARDVPAFAANWRFLSAGPDPWGALASGRGAFVSEQLARRAGLSLGEAVDLPGGALPVVAIHADYGNPAGQVILGEAAFRARFPEVSAERFGLLLDAPEAEIRAALADLGIDDSAITDQAALKAFSLGVFERTFSVTGALNVLTLAVAGFAMLMSLLTLAAMRLPQVAPVWASGLTRVQLGRMELARTALLAGFTALAALPLGLALAWMLLAVVNVAAFGWRLPMMLFPGDWARLFALALLAGALASAWPAWRLARTPPAQLLKVFANER